MYLMKSKSLLCIISALLVSSATSIDAKQVNKPSSKNAKYSNEMDKEKSVKQENSTGKPQLTISGAATFHGNFGDPDLTYYKGNPTEAEKTDKDTSATRMCAGEANIEVKAIGTLENGVRYLADFDIDAMKDDTEVDKMYISFSKDGWGTLQMGNLKGPDAKCIYSGQQLLGGTGGLDGTIPHEIDFATGVISPINLIGYSNKATKIVYYSPRIYGFQFGFAFTPDTKQHGHNDKNRRTGLSSNGNDNGMFQKGDGSQKPAGRNNMAFALTHEYQFKNGIGTKISAVYVCESTKKVTTKSYGYVEYPTAQENESNKDIKPGIGDVEKSKDVKLRNARSFALSATVSYQKWSFGVGYLNNGKSRTPKDIFVEKVVGDGVAPAGNGVANGTTRIYTVGNFLGTENSNAGQAWNCGIQYRLNDNWTLSGVYHHMSRKVDTGAKTRGNALNFAAEYKICDGLMVFFEYDYVQTKSHDLACAAYNSLSKDKKAQNAIKKQAANLFVVGAKVSF